MEVNMFENKGATWAGMLLAAASLPALSGCAESYPDTPQPIPAVRTIDNWEHVGEGVYSFKHTNDWGRDLQHFISENPTVEITAMYVSSEGGYSHIHEVLIDTEERERAVNHQVFEVKHVNDFAEVVENFKAKNPELEISAMFTGAESGYSHVSSVLIVTTPAAE
jgi:hypothetical protein